MCDFTGEGFGADGEKTGGVASVRTVRGTIQSLTSSEALMLDSGARNTGSLKVYSSSRLNYRQRGKIGARSFVSHQGAVYEIIDCFHFDNKLISSYILSNCDCTFSKVSISFFVIIYILRW